MRKYIVLLSSTGTVPETGGARAYRSRHVSRAVRCPSTCGRSLQSPGSLASTAVVAGVRRCSSGSTMRRSVLRSRRLRRACMARGSTGACSARSQDCVEPRLALWDGLQGRGGPPRVRWRAEYYLCDDCRLSDRVAGGGLARRAAAASSPPPATRSRPRSHGSIQHAISPQTAARPGPVGLPRQLVEAVQSAESMLGRLPSSDEPCWLVAGREREDPRGASVLPRTGSPG